MKTNPDANERPKLPAADPQPAWLKAVHERITELRFGTVQIVVHEGRVAQIESTQRVRLTADDSAAL